MSMPRAAVQLRFQSLAVARHGEAEQEVNHRNDDEHLESERLPRRLEARGLPRGRQIEDADDQAEARVLEEADEGVHQRRNDEAQRLRQDDQAEARVLEEA